MIISNDTYKGESSFLVILKIMSVRDTVSDQNVAITIHSNGFENCMKVPKGFLTLAQRETCTVEIAKCENYKMFHNAVEGGCIVNICNTISGHTIMEMQLKGFLLKYFCVDDVNVSGVRNMAVQILKKHLRIPVDLDMSFTTIPDYSCYNTAMQNIQQMNLHTVGSDHADYYHTDGTAQHYLQDAFKELYHFNAKFISRISSSCYRYNLRACQGVCLNTCVAVFMPKTTQDSAIIANTLETICLSDEVVAQLTVISQDQENACCSLKFLASCSRDKVHKIIHVIPTHVREEIHQCGIHFHPENSIYFTMSDKMTPILIGSVFNSKPDKFRANGIDNSKFFANTYESAVNRLRYIQSTCDMHNISRQDLYTMTRAWALKEIQIHPLKRDSIFALSSVRSPSLFAHATFQFNR